MRKFFGGVIILMLMGLTGYTQGDSGVKMKYVYSLEEAIKKAKREKKPIFFNCYADWAHPCHEMDRRVFSDENFAEWMDKHFVNLWVDVTTVPDGRALAEKYKIRFQAHYLVLDEKGEILLRIVGGSHLPEFQENVALALKPETSLKGLGSRYEKGDRSVKTLKNYAVVLKLADELEKYREVAEEYFAKIKPKEWSKQENWKLFNDKAVALDDKMFRFLLEHREEFEKNNGEEVIQNKIANACIRVIYPVANGDSTYQPAKMLEVYMLLQNSNIPQDHMVYGIYDMAKARGEKKVGKMIDVLQQYKPQFEGKCLNGLDLSLGKLSDLSKEDRDQLIAYLSGRMKEVNADTRKLYEERLNTFTHTSGIAFTDIPFAEALKKAGEMDKLIFLDCYTSWCGPCKMMSAQVFSQKTVGDFFNRNFINLKIDMEKGEGKGLADRYEVKAFPTMMLLDKEGRVVYKIMGGSDTGTFMKKIQRGVQPEYCYYDLKARYAAGDRSVEMMPYYLMTMTDAGELKGEDSDIRGYLAGLGEEDKYTKAAWNLFDYYINGYKMPEFSLICANRDKFAQQVGEQVVDKKIESILFPAVIGYLDHKNSAEDMEEMRKLIVSAGFPEQFSLSYLNRIVGLYESKDLKKMMDYYETTISGVADAHTKLNLDVLLNTLMQEAPAEIRQRAVGYVKKSLDGADPKAVNSYRKLLDVLSVEG